MNIIYDKTIMDIDERDYPHIIAMAKKRWLRIDTYVTYGTCDNEKITRLEITYSEYTKNRQVAEEFMKVFRNIFILAPTLPDFKEMNPQIDLDVLSRDKVFLLIKEQVLPDKDREARYFIGSKIYEILYRHLPANDPKFYFHFTGQTYRLNTYKSIPNARDDELMQRVADSVEQASRELSDYFQSPQFLQDLDDEGLIVHPQKRRRSSRTKQNKRSKQ